MNTILRRLTAAAVLLACAACADMTQDSYGHRTPSNFAQVPVGKTTAKEVRDLLGTPSRTMWLRANQREAWAYQHPSVFGMRLFWVELSADGVVSATSDTPDAVANAYRVP